MPMTVAIEPMAKARFRNRARFSTGPAARFSASTNSARNTTAPMKPAITSALPQPAVGPWITANISANRATATVTWPPQSSERPSGEDEFRASPAETATLISASRPMATGAQRQLAFGSLPYLKPASQPPRTGDSMLPADRAAAQTATARARAFGVGVPAATMARLVGMTAAAPAPAMIMPIHSTATRDPVELLAPGVSRATP